MLDTKFKVTVNNLYLSYNYSWTLIELGSDAQRAFLDSTLQSGNVLANLGLNNIYSTPNSDGAKVFEWLFGTEGSIAMQANVRESLIGVVANTQPVDGDPQGGDFQTADVRIFCTHDRLREGPARADGSKRLFDTVTKEFLKNKLDCATAMAWTIVPDDEDSDQPDTLQICPWFLDYAMQQNTQFQNQFTPGKMATLIKSLRLDKLVTWVKYTPIDLFQLFDKVLVHEMTHTRRGRDRDDVGGYSGYGWKNCRDLSTKRGDEAPYNNADSIALFASISWLLNSGGMVNEDGTFVHGPAADAAADGGDGGDGQGDGGEATKRSAVMAGRVIKKRAPRFGAAFVKGGPLF